MALSKRAERMAIYRAYFISGPTKTSWKDRLRLAAAAIIGIGVLIGALVLSLSLLFILIPVGIVAYLFRGRIAAALLRRAGIEPQQAARPPRGAETTAASDGTVIETDYTIIEPERREPR